MVKPTKFLWLLLEIESCAKEEQAGSILTSYHKIGDTESHVSFHFYATFSRWRNALGGKNTWVVSSFSTHGDKELWEVSEAPR